MKNKVLIGVAVILTLLLFGVRYQFKQKVEEFKKSISSYEKSQLENLRTEKENRVAALSSVDKKLYRLLTEAFDETKSIIEKDTTISFLYLSEGFKYNMASLKYLDCLYRRCVITKQNEANQELINSKVSQLESKFGETFSIWYPKLKNNKLLQQLNNSEECMMFYTDMFEIAFDASKWEDFERFLVAYQLETKELDIENKQAEDSFASSVASTKSELTSGALDYFDEKVLARKSQLVSTETKIKEFNSPTLGVITYSVNKLNFDKSAFQSIADEAFEEQWKYHSLITGSMPYFYCYGSNNSCEYGCSKISVKTGGSDVLVTIKDISGDVIRHGYIMGGDTFTFNVPDGRYQVFFYSGTGWNPKKFMTTTSCGTLSGGFVSGESFSKDNIISLYSQVMTYELILQQNGNLNTEPSSMSEAFK